MCRIYPNIKAISSLGILEFMTQLCMSGTNQNVVDTLYKRDGTGQYVIVVSAQGEGYSPSNYAVAGVIDVQDDPTFNS